MQVRLKLLHPNAKLPAYGSADAACADAFACIIDGTDAPIVIHPGCTKLIPFGWAASVPSGYEMQVRARSGLALKSGIMMANGVGCIDADYRGECGAILYNAGTKPFIVNHGDRIAQIKIAPAPRIEYVQVAYLNPTLRGEGGFGSTGV